ncbi:MAG: F0F1 ATP synthase subunit B [Actinomycetales bacterium]|nr:F0F1 ATP synthase subunit B [Actinomycetales bacterium]
MNLLASEEAPNVLAVPLDELILGIVAFLIVFWALSKLALPGIRKALEERTSAIEGGIARAEQREAEAAALYERYQAQLAEARTEAAQIRAQAQSDRVAIVEEARSEAAEAAAAVTARADAAISAERAATVASLRREVGTLALSLAGKVVGESLEDDARARATVDRFIADLEAQASAGH